MSGRIGWRLSWAALLAGCGSSSGSGGGAADAPAYYSGTTDGAAVDAAPATVTASGAVVSKGGSTNPIVPLQGVSVCVIDHAEIACVTTNAAGKFSLRGIPPSSDVGMSFTRSGYYGVVSLTHTVSSDFVAPTASMSTDAVEAQVFAAAGWTYPADNMGILRAHAQGAGKTDCDGLDQTAFTASTAATPVYEAACSDGGALPGPDPTFTATTTSGTGYFLLPSGSVDVTASHSNLLCSVSPFSGWGWASSKTNTASAVVLAGHETIVALQCN